MASMVFMANPVQMGGDIVPSDHPYLRNLLPELSPEEYEALKADIAARGIQVPIEVDEQGNLLDGYHRLRAARELGLPEEAIPYVVREGMTEEEKVEHVLRVNLLRRHLSREQKRELAVSLRQQGWTVRQIADAIGVGKSTVADWLSALADVSESGHEQAPDLPDAIIDRLGRRQPARKPRQAPRPTEEVGPPVLPPQPEAFAGGTVGLPEPMGAEEEPGEALPWPDADLAEEQAEGEAEDLGPVPEPEPAEPVSGEPSEPEATEPAAQSQRAEPEPAAKPGEPSRPEVVTSQSKGIGLDEAWAYFWRCQGVGLLPAPGALDADDYSMAVAIEAALNVLSHTYQADDRGRRALRAWYHSKGADAAAAKRASKLLEAFARYIRSALGIR